MSTDFTLQDAQNILTVLNRSPLNNLPEALALHGSVTRFCAFVDAALGPQPPAPSQTPAPSLPLVSS